MRCVAVIAVQTELAVAASKTYAYMLKLPNKMDEMFVFFIVQSAL